MEQQNSAMSEVRMTRVSHPSAAARQGRGEEQLQGQAGLSISEGRRGTGTAAPIPGGYPSKGQEERAKPKHNS